MGSITIALAYIVGLIDAVTSEHSTKRQQELPDFQSVAALSKNLGLADSGGYFRTFRGGGISEYFDLGCAQQNKMNMSLS